MHDEEPQGNGAERLLRWTKSILSIAGIVAGWIIGLTVWLVSMNGDVAQLKFDRSTMQTQMDRMDQLGTRALDKVVTRQNDVIAHNTATDARLRDIENKIVEMQRIDIELKYKLDNVIDWVRSNSHNFSRPPAPAIDSRDR